MSRITIVSKLRFFAAIAPVILVAASVYLAGGVYIFGGAADAIYEHELAGIKAADAMEIALYKMEWAQSQADGSQIIADQRRSFAHWIDLARDRAQTDDQRNIIASIAQQAEPLFEQLKNSSPRDESVNREARELHARINDLIAADDAVMLQVVAAHRRAASTMLAVILVAGVLIPWLGFAAVYVVCGRIRSGLGAIRRSLESLSARPAGAALAADPDFDTIDRALEGLGFPKPNPMLAE